MRLTILLADAVQAVGGKLYILGGGWSIAGPGPVTMALAIKIEVPWTEANTPHKLKLTLLNEDGQVVKIPTSVGDHAVELETTFEVGRPPGLRAGTPLDVPLAINLSALPLQPDSRYVWHCSIDGEPRDEWQVAFSTLPTKEPEPRSPE